MAKDRLTRKLAVILHADVVGSTKLVQQNEALAHERIQATFHHFSKTINAYGGIAREIRGDALVAEFERASDTVTAALAFQVLNGEINSALDDDIQPQLRIGISLGEVIIADNTITGEGVVLAQRLEQLADPGGVVVQGSVSETVPTRMPFDFENLGEKALKGFDQPVRAYSAKLRQGEELPQPEIQTTPKSAPAENSQVSEKPSIAVLPFANMSNDPEQEYFADGIVEDIITALSHIRQWRVVARNSSFVYKGRNVDIREVARDLSVRYVLEGSVRKSGNRLRITGQLIDAESGTHLWADKYDGDLADVFELQDKITESVVGAIEPSLRLAEIERSSRKLPDDMGAYDLYLKALPNLYAMRPDQNKMALELLHKAINLDPNYAPALAFLAWGYEQRLVRDWGSYGGNDAGTAIALAHRAIAADRNDAHVMATAGFVLLMVGRDYEQGLQAVDRAKELNPNIAFVSMLIGVSQTFAGDPEEALIHFDNAIRVSPGDPGAFFCYAIAGLAHLFCGRPEEALELSRKAARMYADWDSNYWALIPALVQLGRTDEARSFMLKFQELSPNATVTRLGGLLPVRNPDYLNLILDGMAKAGLPE
jgi:TolB-like protein/Flp pilus assembly protein TadD